MSAPADLSPTIIETLYGEALALADEAREAFELSARTRDAVADDADLTRIALSCEALRTTTRMMHTIAWLLNQRAFLAGDLSEFQLRRHGRLAPAPSEGGTDQTGQFSAQVREVIDRSRRFYARIERLDRAWQERFVMRPAAIRRLHDRFARNDQALLAPERDQRLTPAG